MASTNPSTVQASTVVKLQGSKPLAAPCRMLWNSMEFDSCIFSPFFHATRHPATLYHLGCRRGGVSVCVPFFSFITRTSPSPQICPSFRLFAQRGRTHGPNENLILEIKVPSAVSCFALENSSLFGILFFGVIACFPANVREV